MMVVFGGRQVIEGAMMLPLEATADTPWDDLEAVLNNTALTTPTISEWKEQCVAPFEIPVEFGLDGSFAVISNTFFKGASLWCLFG